MHTPTKPAATTDTLPAITASLGQAVLAAYYAFCQQSSSDPSKCTPADGPAGWEQVGTLTGWDDIWVVGGAVELFGLIYRNQSDPGQFLIAIRGTASPSDLLRDLDVPPTRFITASGDTLDVDVHSGFFGIYHGAGGGMAASMQQQLFSFLSENAGQISTLYVTGHSLGSALAELFTFDLAVASPAPAFAVVPINFAAPRVGFSSWVNAFAAHPISAATLRVVNQYDVVPTVPPWPYEQVAQEYDIAFTNETFVLNPVTVIIIRHSMMNYLTVGNHVLAGGSPLWPFTFPDNVDPSVTDQAVAPSAEAVKDAEALLARVRAALPPPPRSAAE